MIKLIEKPDVPLAVRKSCVQTLGQLCRKINFSDYASRIVHPLVRLLQQPTFAELRSPIMDTISTLVLQLGSDFIIFVPMINKVIAKYRIQHANYDLLISKLLKNEPLPLEIGADGNDFIDTLDDMPTADPTGMKKLPVNQQHLKKAWETSQRSTRDDWTEWLRRLSVELLKESPSHALRACASLAGVYHPLARELFNAAFVSCWTELYDQFQVRCLTTNLNLGRTGAFVGGCIVVSKYSARNAASPVEFG
jgi:FKBP12-rapamycin complex-associated protein